MNGNELISLLSVALNNSVVLAITGAIIASIFLRRDTSTKEFEIIKAGHFKGAIDSLLKTGKMTYDLDEYDERSLKQEKKDWLSWAKNVQSWKKLSPYI